MDASTLRYDVRNKRLGVVGTRRIIANIPIMELADLLGKAPCIPVCSPYLKKDYTSFQSESTVKAAKQ